MVQFVTVRLPRLPMIENSPRILATFRVPERQDIRETVRLNAASRFDVRRIVDQQLDDLDIPEPPSLLDIELTVNDALAEFDVPEPPTVDEIVSDVETTVLTPIETELTSVRTDITDEVNGLVGDVERELGDEFDSLAQGVNGIVTDIEDLGVDISAIGETVNDLNDIGSDAVEDAVETAIEAVEPEFNDSGLFSDPVGFAIGFVQEASDVIVDPDASQRLQDKVSDE